MRERLDNGHSVEEGREAPCATAMNDISAPLPSDAAVAAPASAEGGEQATVAPYSWYVLAMLTFSFALACIDRLSFNILIEPMKRDLGASDTQMGLLGGAAFVLFYAAFGVPLARIADRGNRSLLLSLSVTAWSAITVLTGFCTNVFQMALTRVGLGIAEAGGTPASLSLIADMFPRSRMPFAASIYQSGMAIGGLVGAPVIGFIAHEYGWRVALWALGAPGILIGIVIYMTVREPRRMNPVAAKGTPAPRRTSLLRDCRVLFGDRRFSLLFLSQVMIGIPTGAIVVWLGVLLMRDFGVDLRVVGLISMLYFGVILMIAFIGSGYFISRLIARTGRHSYGALVPGLAAMLAAPLGVMMLLADSLEVSMILSCLFFFVMFVSRPAGNNLALEFAAPEQRGLAVSMILVATSLIGGGGGPALVGMISDRLAGSIGDVESLRWAMMTVVPLEVFLSGVAFMLMARAMRAEEGASSHIKA